MPINGSEMIDNPWETLFSPMTDFFGSGFWLIPLSFIAIALYVKTRNTVTVSVFLIAGSLMLASGNMFTGHPEMGFIYFIFATMGVIGVIVSIYLMRK